jgi:tRNA1Val (adenine37-N6)-methyltransferase
MANANAARNGLGERVSYIAGDVGNVAGMGGGFEHVFFNPPFHSAVGTESPDRARNVAMRDPGSMIAKWTKTALRAVHPEGTVTAILRFDRVGEMLAAARGISAVVFPLYPRHGVEPKRAIVRIVAGEYGPVRNGGGLILHREDGGNTEEAEAILRGGAALSIA